MHRVLLFVLIFLLGSPAFSKWVESNPWEAFKRSPHILQKDKDMVCAIPGALSLSKVDIAGKTQEELIKIAQEGIKKCDGPVGADTGQTLYSLGQKYQKEGNSEGAKDTFSAAFYILENNLKEYQEKRGPNHYLVTGRKQILAKCYIEQQQYSKAENYLQQVLSAYQSNPKYTPEEALEQLAFIYRQQGRTADLSRVTEQLKIVQDLNKNSFKIPKEQRPFNYMEKLYNPYKE